ncbi:MAG: hypothetical protein D6725_01505 [Planctomycetota bacterium]|nr:MAG: hypothetical protein D6725_01505 [Planctomycetota bacterium]
MTTVTNRTERACHTVRRLLTRRAAFVKAVHTCRIVAHSLESVAPAESGPDRHVTAFRGSARHPESGPLCNRRVQTGKNRPMKDLLARLGFVAVCVLLPVAWGIAVNYAFDLWHQKRRRASLNDDESVFPDYQI